MTTGTQKLANYCAKQAAANSAPPLNPCACMGPQNGQPLCPCAMRGVQIKNGRYVMPERDLGPAPTTPRILNPPQK